MGEIVSKKNLARLIYEYDISEYQDRACKGCDNGERDKCIECNLKWLNEQE